MRAHNAASSLIAVVIVSSCLGLAGCGTNIDQVFSQAAGATGRTLFDLFLTDFVNAVADAMDQAAAEPDDGAQDGGTDNGDGDGGDATDDGGQVDDGGGPVDVGAGDAAAGEAFFTLNGCGACHGDDGASGFAVSLVDVGLDTMLGKLDGSQGHAGGAVDGVTSQDADDVVAYLASLHGGGDIVDGGGVPGDPVAGEAVFASGGCSACHCEDASGGCALGAPSLAGVDADTLDGKVRGDAGHVGGTSELTDTEMADLAAYLGSL